MSEHFPLDDAFDRGAASRDDEIAGLKGKVERETAYRVEVGGKFKRLAHQLEAYGLDLDDPESDTYADIVSLVKADRDRIAALTAERDKTAELLEAALGREIVLRIRLVESRDKFAEFEKLCADWTLSAPLDVVTAGGVVHGAPVPEIHQDSSYMRTKLTAALGAAPAGTDLNMGKSHV